MADSSHSTHSATGSPDGLFHTSANFYYVSAFIAFIAGNMCNYSLVIFSRKLTDSDGFTGLVMMFVFMPTLFFGMYAGILLDRFSRRAMLYFSQSLMALAVFLLALFLELGVMTYQYRALLLLVASLNGISFAFIMPSRMAILGDLVSDHNVGRATIFVNIVIIVAFGLSPMLVGFVKENYSYRILFYFICFLVLLSISLLIPIRFSRESQLKSAPAKFLDSLGESFAFLRTQPAIAELLIFMPMAVFTVGIAQVLLPEYARSILHLSESQRGAFLSVLGPGLLIGGLSAGPLMGALKRKGRFLLISALVIALLTVLMGLFISTLVVAVILFFTGIFLGFLTSLIPAIIQGRTPNQIRGRVMSMYSVLFFLTPAIVGVLAGFFSDLLGIIPTVILFGFVMTQAIGISAILLGRLRAL